MEDRQAFIQGLRELADFLETREAVPLPNGFFSRYTFPTDFAAAAKALGSFEKAPSKDFFGAERKFGPITLRVFTDRSAVCTRKVVGTRTIHAEPERTVEVVEWECNESILEPK